MSIRPIVLYPDPVLLRPTEAVETVDDEIRRLVRDMTETMYLAPGIGLAANQVGVSRRVCIVDLHVGEDGREVPSNHASPDEIVELASVLAEFDRGACEIIPRSFGRGYDEADRELILRMYEASGRPVELNLLFPSGEDPMSWQKSLDWCREQNARGARLRARRPVFGPFVEHPCPRTRKTKSTH